MSFKLKQVQESDTNSELDVSPRNPTQSDNDITITIYKGTKEGVKYLIYHISQFVSFDK